MMDILGIDAFRWCLALGPVAVYLVMLGGINLFRRPFLVSGTRDAAALGLAVSGLVVVGPVELFLPVSAAIRFGPYVWVFVVALYALCLLLVLLVLHPRLVVYNITADRLRSVLADVVSKLDEDARWAGDSLAVPRLGVQLHLDRTPGMRNVTLVATGANQNYFGWRRLEVALGEALAEVEVPRNSRAAALILAGTLIAGTLVWMVAQDPQAVAQALMDMLRV